MARLPSADLLRKLELYKNTIIKYERAVNQTVMVTTLASKITDPYSIPVAN